MSGTKPKSKTVKPDEAQKPTGDAAVLVPVPSGEPPAEDAELVAVRTKTAPRFYRAEVMGLPESWRYSPNNLFMELQQKAPPKRGIYE